MRLVDFAIDLAAVLGASRSVASKHVALRRRQLDRYGRTSSVAAALRARAREPQSTEVTIAARRTATAPAASPGGQAHVVVEPEEESPGQRSGDSAAHASKEGVPRAHGTEAEIPTEAGDSRVQATNTVQSSMLRGTDEPTGKQNQPSSSTLRYLRLKSERGEEGRLDEPQSQKVANDEVETAEDGIPEGVNLDNLFRTSRGRRLSPLWDGDKRARPMNPYISGNVARDVAQTSHGSRILEEMDGKAKQDASIPSVATHISSMNKRHPNTRTAKDRNLPEPAKLQSEKAADQPVAAHESHRETEEVEVTRYPDPVATIEGTSVKHSRQTEKPVSKKDASQLGELLGAAVAMPKYELRESRVPSTRLGRIWNYGGLAAGMFAGAIGESFSRATGGGSEGSLMLSPANMERLVAKLSKMRGAALKLGQMMSFQDSKMLPASIQEVLQRVQDRADYMPAWQRDRVLANNLGGKWRELFEDFEEKPIAAASIGQVHRATLKSNGARVAVKIQFPGVADSINSDLDNLGILLAATKLLPKGLYLNKTIANARTELTWECDYEREAQCAQKYRDLLASEHDVFLVPRIYPEASGRQVLTMEFMDGVGVTRIHSFTQEQRDWIGTQILRLCLREIIEFHFMQTDPNWTNFLFNSERDRLVLLDFGASREYPERFITMYVQLLAAASRSDRETVKALSEKLGYLTGHESKTMLDAHIASVLTLAEPFLKSAPEVYDFRDQTITERVKSQIPVMVRERLAPPPEETYSLHRKLSGAFLLCARLGSRVRCREMFEKGVAKSGALKQQV